MEGYTLDELAIKLLQTYATDEPFYGGFSGGIDSQIIHSLAERAEVEVDWYYNVSPIDPQIIRDFIKQEYPTVEWAYHARGYWNKHFMSNGLPMRTARWCCGVIKEPGGVGRVKILGMRKSESQGRKGYKCFMDNPEGGHWLLPIVNWTDEDRRQYVSQFGLKSNKLYSLGFKRTGCVLCPFQGKHDKKLCLKYFPEVVKLWKLACDRYIKERNTNPKRKPVTFKNGDEYFNWWIALD